MNKNEIDMLRAMRDIAEKLYQDAVKPHPGHLYLPSSIARRAGWLAKWARNGTVCWGKHYIPEIGTVTVFTCEPGQADFGDPDDAS